MEENEVVLELTDSEKYANENQAFDEIRNILSHPGLRNQDNLRRRVWLYLHTVMGSKF